MAGDTIAAIATAQAPAGIGMVRLSGKEAISIAEGMLRPVGKRRLSALRGYSGLLGRAYDENGDIDEAVAFLYRAPHSYTGENVVEICCHGGAYLLQRVLRRCFALGARPAEPGEFTRRAFLSGRISLTEAEAVAGLIASSGRQQASAALAALDGALYRRIKEIRQQLLSLSAALSAWLDYPDEEQPEVSARRLEEQLSSTCSALTGLLQGYDQGKILSEGIETVIAGRPNVGKSTLMNLLSGEECSIVTSLPGTTRDVVRTDIRLGEMVLHLSDTAGIHETADPVERVGIERAQAALSRAQLVLLVLDGSQELTAADRGLLRRLQGCPAIAVLNKADLGLKMDRQALSPCVRRAVAVSAKKGEGLQELERAVQEVLQLDALDASQAMLVSERQRAAAGKAQAAVREALEALRAGMTLDAVGIAIDAAIDALLSLTGERATQAVVDEVFAKFCVGK
ncbi:MAG: tRNA uridine-5-carboxymethylaminomethyl(34) synthesis GTPase MnmE [Provencibacterium sp.]|nr:tRNA uridine-5-carboxymethylaminomethyl(34) synthesis GTPase MnmE [Provencibacterium sp.]